MNNPLDEALREASAFLETAGYPYAVIGGLATQLWGESRFTYDVDIKVLAQNTDYATLRAAIQQAFPEPGRPLVPTNPLIVSVKIGNLVVDFLLTIPGYEEQMIRRAVRMPLGELLLPVCTPEDLIIQKAIAGRPKDWQDIEGIVIEQRDRLDQDYLQNWLSQFAEVLEQPHILDKYHQLWSSATDFTERRADLLDEIGL